MKEKRVEVVGVSGDRLAGLSLFKKVNALNYALLSDFDGAIAKGFGVPVGAGGKLVRKVDGKEHTLQRGVTTRRWTFVVKNGKVVYKNDKVNAAGDSRAVLEFLAE